MKLLAHILIILISIQGVNAQSDSLLIPISVKKKRELIKHTYYQLEYDELHEQAAWVFYKLTPESINGIAERKNKFKPDKLVVTGSAELIDYKGSGYDRGHLCPAAVMKINQKAMDESFYMSNMSPQLPAFNRGKWKQLESQVRKWVEKEDTLFVVTGPIFSDSLGVIGINKVTIPAYYYKIIYDPTGEKKMIAFIMPNHKIENSILEYVVTVDEVELKTGLDFFSALPDELELKLESEIDLW
ncbi:MAG: DNA/RNA endonuclease [Flavobacteriales bacterium]|nr:MAG: DNA/RNA endonuclease [Flavobacteriales bacterium]